VWAVAEIRLFPDRLKNSDVAFKKYLAPGSNSFAVRNWFHQRRAPRRAVYVPLLLAGPRPDVLEEKQRSSQHG